MDEIKELPFDVREEAQEVHMVPGIEHTLMSTNEFALEKYVTLFDEDMVNIYDATNTKITVSRGAVLQGWRVPSKGLWRVPLQRWTESKCRHGASE